MSRLGVALRDIGTWLDRSKHSWALVGGLAVSARSEPRFTRDVDLALLVADDREAESLGFFLLSQGYRVVATVEQQAVGRLATLRLLPPHEPEEGVVVDLLFASSGIEREVVERAEILEVLPGQSVPVARTEHLIALKVLSRSPDRPQDELDLKALLARADSKEIGDAREALRLIHERGFARDRDLLAGLEEVVQRFASD